MILLAYQAIYKAFGRTALANHVEDQSAVDIADVGARIAVEMDGINARPPGRGGQRASHQSAMGQARDVLKTAILNALGWRVLRVKNQELLEDPAACAQRVLQAVDEAVEEILQEAAADEAAEEVVQTVDTGAGDPAHPLGDGAGDPGHPRTPADES